MLEDIKSELIALKIDTIDYLKVLNKLATITEEHKDYKNLILEKEKMETIVTGLIDELTIFFEAVPNLKKSFQEIIDLKLSQIKRSTKNK